MRERHVAPFVVLIVVFLFVSALLSQGQVGGSVAQAPINGPSYTPQSNPQHASQHDMATEQSLYGTNNVTTAHGERPLWEFGSDRVERPLGDVAREYRQQWLYGTEKSRIRWEQQGTK